MKKTITICLLILAIVALMTGCDKSLSAGDKAPDFVLKNLDGQYVSLSGLRGQTVLLNFWATWCGPCRSEMPILQELSEDTAWKARGLVILTVNIQESGTDVRDFMASNAFSFPTLLDSAGNTAKLYNVSSIPQTHIIDKDGIIKVTITGAIVDKARIEDVLSIILDDK
jgi:cytochrome c biogenesis protein CcmG, thiol:disulfide interchange protein DsbE